MKYMLVLMTMLLIFLLAAIIVILIKNHNANSKSNFNTYSDYDVTKGGQTSVYKNLEKPLNNEDEDIVKPQKKKSGLAIGCLSAIIALVVLVVAALSIFNVVRKTSSSVFDKKQSHEVTKTELGNISFAGNNYKEENYEKLINDMVEAKQIKNEVLLERIYLSLDKEHKISFMEVCFIEIDGDKCIRHSVNYEYNRETKQKAFMSDNDEEKKDFDKSRRKEYMTIKDGSQLFMNYLKVIDDSKNDIDINFSADKYTSVDRFYNEDNEYTKYNYYLVNFDDNTAQKMPEDYKKDSYGVFSVLRIDRYGDEDVSYEDDYVYDWYK